MFRGGEVARAVAGGAPGAGAGGPVRRGGEAEEGRRHAQDVAEVPAGVAAKPRLQRWRCAVVFAVPEEDTTFDLYHFD